MWSYYEGLCARVCTDAWETGLIPIGCGVPQGCTASTINFDLVFQILLDYHSSLLVGKRGYWIAKSPSVVVEKPTYADDVALVEPTAIACQASVNAFSKVVSSFNYQSF